MEQRDPDVPPPLPEERVSATSSPVPVLGYATQAPSNQPAVLSLVFGVLCFIPLFAPGVLAIVYGRRGLRKAGAEAAGRGRLARTGVTLGKVNLAWSVLFWAIVPVAVMHARRQAQTIACASNLRSLAQAAQMYAAQNKGFLPPTVGHLRSIFPGAMGTQVFVCPACGTNPRKPPVFAGATVSSHYYLLTPAAKFSQIMQPDKTVLAYEPPTHHDGASMNLAFCDGHVEVIHGPLAAKVAAELAAGQNPPPSKP